MSPNDVSGRAGSARGAGAASALLTVRGLQKRFGTNQVLNSIDLTLDRGRVLVLIGSSGSGKTTILRCLNGLEQAAAGTVDVARRSA